MICLLEGCRDPFTLGFFINAFLFNKMSTEKLWSSIDPKFFFNFTFDFLLDELSTKRVCSWNYSTFFFYYGIS